MLIEYHRNLLSDKVRHDAFHNALKGVIKKGETVVADIGSGTGLMGFLASQLGAKDVYLYEYGDVMGLSKRLAKDNKIKNLHFVHGHSTEMKNPAPVDVIVSETLGNYAFEEHMIATIENAKRFLKPGGTIIPQRVEQFACPITDDRFFKELSAWDDVGFGLDFEAAKTMSFNNIYVRAFGAKDLLDGSKAAQRWDNVDFREKNSNDRRGKAEWKLKEETTIYGLAVWWNCELVPGIELSTGPLAPKTHWEQLYFPVLEPVEAKKGDTLSVALSSQSTYEAGTTIRWNINLQKADGATIKQSMDLTKGFLG